MRVLFSTWGGRAFLAGVLLKLLTMMTGTTRAPFALADRMGVVAIVLGGAYLIYRLARDGRGRLLWRVRRRLTLSYVFIAVVPVLLLITFFVLSGLLLFSNVSSYLVRTRLEDREAQARLLVNATLLEIERSLGEPAQLVLVRRYAAARTQFPGASMAIVPAGARSCGISRQERTRGLSQQTPITIGEWAHDTAPKSLPEWVSCDGFAGLLLYQSRTSRDEAQLIVRAVAVAKEQPTLAVLLDVPVDADMLRRLREDTGIEVARVSVIDDNNASDPPVTLFAGRTNVQLTRTAATAESDLPNAVTLVDVTDWVSGRTERVALTMRSHIAEMYLKLAGSPEDVNLSQGLLILLALIGGLFLIIEASALVMGVALARSITGSVHQLFEGTERVRQGDFSHKIAVTTRDQLGELAESFNSMTSSIDELLRQMEQKKRLEEELRIAREIQMSLLPQGPLHVDGLSSAAVCVPAREVGGDYYDFLPLSADRTAVLIADVSGKGTSAAFYMAELKGLILALSKTHPSPRQLLIHANRIISANLDSRSFITMTYAVIDMRSHTITYARAGHTPLIHVPGSSSKEASTARILVPDGMVLGLKLDGGERFEQLLEEVTLPLTTGDLFVFFTDGISEAMNDQSDCFGDARLASLLEQHRHLPLAELRERILREIEHFAGPAGQHDDMTMILLRVEELTSPAARMEDAAMRVSLAGA